MSLVDVAIPGVIGCVLLLWPQAMFVGSKVTPDPRRTRTMRMVGAVLLAASLIYLAVALAGA